MTSTLYLRLQLVVFTLVSAAFTNIYVTQPVLPVLQAEFGADAVLVSFTVSAVILGIAIANLPFGLLADRFDTRVIIASGGVALALGGLACAATTSLWVLIGARFVQGLFIPALTTCLAAYLARSLPAARLKVIMGAYVSATVLGGMGGRLFGGWIHPPLHWRYAFVTTALLTLAATAVALKALPRDIASVPRRAQPTSFLQLLTRGDCVRIYLCAAGGFAVFSSIFNYLPFRLATPPFELSTEATTLLYLVYVMGIFMGPIAGQFSNRFGTGATLLGGALVTGAAMLLLLAPSLTAVVAGLLALCIGFFAVHAAAVGALNSKLEGGQGRANALYVLFYYLGGWLGITLAGLAYQRGGWNALVVLCLMLLSIPAYAGWRERQEGRRSDGPRKGTMRSVPGRER